MRVFILVIALGVSAPLLLSAQQTATRRPEAISIEESTLLTNGWANLAQGDQSKAAQVLETLRATYPRSVHVLDLGVEIDIARSGPLAALDGYDRWHGGRSLESPFTLRRIARALLGEAAKAGNPSSIARVEALVALDADGDTAAHAQLVAAAAGGSLAELAALAERGNESAVANVVTLVGRPETANKLGLIRSLVASGSRQAAPPLTAILQDTRQRPELQAAAASGLAELGVNTSANMARLHALLAAANSPPEVKVAAAGALLRFGDQSGASLLRRHLESPVPDMRLRAAQALARDPTTQWRTVVAGLLQEAGEATVQLGAAELMAPVDRELAKATLERLLHDRDLATREQAGRLLARDVATDLPTLRTLLRSADPQVQASAAGRVLELTR